MLGKHGSSESEMADIGGMAGVGRQWLENGIGATQWGRQWHIFRRSRRERGIYRNRRPRLQPPPKIIARSVISGRL